MSTTYKLDDHIHPTNSSIWTDNYKVPIILIRCLLLRKYNFEFLIAKNNFNCFGIMVVNELFSYVFNVILTEVYVHCNDMILIIYKYFVLVVFLVCCC